MKLSSPPKRLNKSRRMLEQYGNEICGQITESNAFDVGSRITDYFRYFRGNPQIDVGDFDRFVGALGFVFARCVETVSDWKLEWLSLSEEDLLDGVDCLTNENHSLLVYPIGLVSSDFLRKTHKSESFFKALVIGSFPAREDHSLQELVM